MSKKENKKINKKEWTTEVVDNKNAINLYKETNLIQVNNNEQEEEIEEKKEKSVVIETLKNIAMVVFSPILIPLIPFYFLFRKKNEEEKIEEEKKIFKPINKIAIKNNNKNRIIFWNLKRKNKRRIIKNNLNKKKKITTCNKNLHNVHRTKIIQTSVEKSLSSNKKNTLKK